MNSQRRRIGQVVRSQWDERQQAIVLELQLDGSGQRLTGYVPCGQDPVTGSVVTPARLKRTAPDFFGMVVYDHSGRLDVRNLTPEQLKRLSIRVSLDRMQVGVAAGPSDPPDTNRLLSALLR